MARRRGTHAEADTPPVLDLNNLQEILFPPAARPPTTMLCVRFEAEAVRRIRAAARHQDVTQSEFVRRAALEVADRTIQRATRPVIESVSGSGGQGDATSAGQGQTVPTLAFGRSGDWVRGGEPASSSTATAIALLFS